MHIKLNKPIKWLQFDFSSKLQSWKVDKWFTNQDIVFELSAPYSQEENKVSERTSCTIMEMVRATILEKGINDTFWLEVVLAMTHINNLWPTWALKGSISPVKIQDKDHLNKDLSNLHYLRILGSTVYIFLHEEKHILKLAKWDARALKIGRLIGFDKHTIYKVHIGNHNKVIKVKDL